MLVVGVVIFILLTLLQMHMYTSDGLPLRLLVPMFVLNGLGIVASFVGFATSSVVVNFFLEWEPTMAKIFRSVVNHPKEKGIVL